MKVQVQELSPIERKLSIEVEPAMVSKVLDQAYTELGRKVKLAGFRPGKVPRRILEQKFKEQVEDDVIQKVMQSAYIEALKEGKVDPVSSPQVTNQGLKPNQPFSFEARVEVRPKLTPKDYVGLQLKKTEVKVEDARVEEQLESLRKRMGRLEPVVGRDIAQKGDYATVDFDGRTQGMEFPGSKAENATVEVAPGQIVDGNIEALEGLQVGQTKDIPYTFPADYGLAEVRGKDASFKVTLKGLKREVTPELNDEFAKEVQGGDTLADLRQKLRGDLERSLKAKAAQDEREALIKAVSEKNPFEVPKAMVERAIDGMLRGAIRGMSERGIDPRSLNIDFEKLREEMRPRALSEVQGSLLFDAIAEKEGIAVSDDDLEKKLEQFAQEEKVALSQVKKQFKTDDAKETLKLRVREEKTVDFLKSQASYS